MARREAVVASLLLLSLSNACAVADPEEPGVDISAEGDGKADLAAVGLEMVDLVVNGAPAGSVAAALESLKTVVANTSLQPVPSAGSTEVSVGLGGTGSFARGATVTIEGNAFGSGWSVGLGLEIQSGITIQLVFQPAQRDRFNADRTVIPAGTQWTVNYTESLSNTATASLKFGAELFGAGGSVSLAGNLGITSGIENPVSYVLDVDLPLTTFIDERVAAVAQTLIDRQQPNLTIIYARLLGSNAAAILAWVNGRSVGAGQNCGSYYRPESDELGLPPIEYPRTALCAEGLLCCRRTNLIPFSESGTLRCYADTPHYQQQEDCQVLGLTR